MPAHITPIDKRAPTTVRNFAASWRAWETFAQGSRRPAFPARPEDVADWIAELAASGRAVGSIRSDVAAVSAKHRDAGLPDPTRDDQVIAARRAAHRQVGTEPRRPIYALSWDQVEKIVDHIPPDSLRGRRDKALITLGFAAGLRRSEIASLRVADLTWTAAQLVVQVGGRKITVSAEGDWAGGRATQAVRDWLDAGGLGRDDALFPPIAWADRNIIRRGTPPVATPIPGEDVQRILRRRAADAGLAWLPISGDSLRAGRRTEAG